MKQGKRLTVKQMKLLSEQHKNVDATKWLVVHDDTRSKTLTLCSSDTVINNTLYISY